MTRDPSTFGQRRPPLQPRRFGHEQFSFFAMLAAISFTAWAVISYEGIAFVLAIIAFALATMSLPEDMK